MARQRLRHPARRLSSRERGNKATASGVRLRSARQRADDMEALRLLVHRQRRRFARRIFGCCSRRSASVAEAGFRDHPAACRPHRLRARARRGRGRSPWRRCRGQVWPQMRVYRRYDHHRHRRPHWRGRAWPLVHPGCGVPAWRGRRERLPDKRILRVRADAEERTQQDDSRDNRDAICWHGRGGTRRARDPENFIHRP